MKSWWNPLSSSQRSYCLAGKQQNSWGYFFSALSLARADQIASAFQESSCFVLETHLGLWRSCGIWLCRHGDMALHPPSLFLQVMYLIQTLWLKTKQTRSKSTLQGHHQWPCLQLTHWLNSLSTEPGEQHLHHDSFSPPSRACEQQVSSLLLYGRGGGSFACTYSNSRLKVQSSDTRLDVNCRGHFIMYCAWMSLRCCEIFLTYSWQWNHSRMSIALWYPVLLCLAPGCMELADVAWEAAQFYDDIEAPLISDDSSSSFLKKIITKSLRFQLPSTKQKKNSRL